MHVKSSNSGRQLQCCTIDISVSSTASFDGPLRGIGALNHRLRTMCYWLLQPRFASREFFHQ